MKTKNERPSTLLVAINAKYAHTSLAVRALTKALRGAGIPAEYAEYTINQPVREILTDLARRGPERLLLSCYIWNIAQVCALGEQFRLLFPRAVIVLGGPEVSYGAEELLPALPWADAIACGEGEALLPRVLARDEIRGVYRDAACVDMDALPFAYDDLPALKRRVLYYESTRGCPFGCAYCLSSADRRVRARSLNLVFDDLSRFLDARVMKVKFVDRTFNADAARATAIWRWLITRDNGETSFQMELGGDLLTAEQLALLKTARAGLFQFEIGVQSTEAATLRAVARATDLSALKRNVRAIKSGGNIHQHLDLIAGLPGESLDAFAKSYNEVLALRPEQLQLGFLKLLRGSTLYERRGELGLVFSPRAPYEVLRTPAMSFMELSRLKTAEMMTERYYNSGRFSRVLEYLLTRCESPFEAMLALGESMPSESVSQYEAYDLLYDFAVARGCDAERASWLMRADLCQSARPRRLPERCAKGAPLDARKRLLGKPPADGRYYDLFPAYALGLDGDAWTAAAFDYENRDALGRACVSVLA